MKEWSQSIFVFGSCCWFPQS